ncbi:MAG: bifunctional class I SAM-dependent methyltransferase/glycosyltransferase family 2 protein [Chloroflexota bacterium]|nr:bifunctional class I SAM-dependent methyltransferase/glycosyltransferase family 2 protein [Chloroflexota bacterium]
MVPTEPTGEKQLAGWRRAVNNDHMDPGASRYRSARMANWDSVARGSVKWSAPRKAYQTRLAEVYRNLIPSGQRVLESGMSKGDLLSALHPRFGVGIDLSSEMTRGAALRHQHLHVVQGDAEAAPFVGEFDAIVLSDLVGDLWDVQKAFEEARALLTHNGRLVLNFYNRVWEPPLAAAQRLGAATRVMPQNWLTYEDVSNLLVLADFEVTRHWVEVLLPLSLPFVGALANRYLVHFWPFREAALTHFVVARPASGSLAPHQPLVSVVVPARNEAGNITEIFRRVPELGAGTELIFVEGNSRDDTYATIERAIDAHPERRARLLKQTGRGKGDAVRLGFEHAGGEVLMILDADLTVAPEDLPRFYDALVSGKADFVNGVRLVYPMQKQAMRFLNLLGNKFFSLAFSWLLGQSVKDTLCGTKVLWREDYARIAAQRAYFGDFDPFGDFDLLFGAARLNLKIVDMPIRYRERTYGTTNISRWKHGLLLLRMVLFAARRIKFV